MDGLRTSICPWGVHRQLFECRDLSRTERNVAAALVQMPELRQCDQAMAQLADRWLVDTWRQVLELQRSDLVAVSRDRIANSGDVLSRLLANWLYTVSCRGTCIYGDDDLADIYRRRLYDLAKCDHVSDVRDLADHPNCVPDRIRGICLFRYSIPANFVA